MIVSSEIEYPENFPFIVFLVFKLFRGLVNTFLWGGRKSDIMDL